MARVEIRQHLGMNPASGAELTASLPHGGILVAEETADQASGLIRGRPKTRLYFAETLGSVIGVWTGFNRIELRLVDSAGRNRASRHIERPLRNLGANELMDVLAETITAFA